MEKSWLLEELEGWDPGLKCPKQNSRADGGGPVGKQGRDWQPGQKGFQGYRASWVPLEVRGQL